VSSAFVHIASALGGRGGARLGAHLGLQTSASTLLRCIQGSDLPAIGPLRFVGIDDFAFRKGHRYGTVIVDLETHRPVDVLPDRTTPVVEAWLRQHPELTLVTRDRSTEFACAITSGLPEATQVLDRWHLLKNLREVLERFLGRHQQVLRDATPDPKPRSADGEKIRVELLERQRAVLHQMVDLKASGLGTRVIARQLGVSRYLVKRYLQADAVPARRAHVRVRSILDPYLEVLNRRWDEGCRVGAHLLKELKALEYAGTRRPLDAWLRPKRAGTPLPSPAEQQDTLNADRALALVDVEAALPLRIAPQELLWLLWKKVEDRQEDEQHIVSTLLDRLPALQGVVSMVHEFMDLMHRKQATGVSSWLERAHKSESGEVRWFARSLRREQAALEAAISLPWSNGPVKGIINKIKLIKRQMYGRASFQTLRARILTAFPPLHQL